MTQIETDTTGTMREIADYVKNKIGDKYGFMVLVFPFGAEPNVAHYISDAAREDMIKVLRNKADVLEARLDIAGTIGGSQ